MMNALRLLGVFPLLLLAPLAIAAEAAPDSCPTAGQLLFGPPDSRHCALPAVCPENYEGGGDGGECFPAEGRLAENLADSPGSCVILGGKIEREIVCSEIDINDTFCIAGSRHAFPCRGLFAHVRSCNAKNRPALDPFLCGAACAWGRMARGAKCERFADPAAIADLCKSAESRDAAALRRAMLVAPNINRPACARFDATPLHRAAWAGFWTGVTVLVGAQASVNVAQRDGQTPLHLAVVNAGRRGARGAGIVNYLLANGADADAQDNDGETPLLAGLEGDGFRQSAIRALLERGANATLANNRGLAPLHRAALRGGDARALSELLLEHDADANQKGPNDLTPLHLAVMFGNLGLARLFLDNDADPHAQNAAGETPLDLAPAGLAIANLLIEHACETGKTWDAKTKECVDDSASP